MDDTNLIFYTTLSTVSYKFFKNVITINCSDQLNGLRTDYEQETMIPTVENLIIGENTLK
jgi:hypothetical protein